jgi:hypothetical protein
LTVGFPERTVGFDGATKSQNFPSFPSRRCLMPKEPTLPEQTKKVFKETVAIWRNDLFSLLNKPLPIILIIATIILFLLAIRWV